jgi:hypothetical protein
MVATGVGLDGYKAHLEAANLSDAILHFTDDPIEAARMAPTCPILVWIAILLGTTVVASYCGGSDVDPVYVGRSRTFPTT